MTKMAACYPNYELSISQVFTAAASTISQAQQQQNRQIPTVLKQTQESSHQQLQQKDQSSYFPSLAESSSVAVVTEAAASVNNLIAAAKNFINTSKNYFVPLHVDCSVEYELPKQPKPPAGQRFEPLLMIHPCYFRKMESQRRSPFINNMPNSCRNSAAMFVGVALVSKGSNNEPASTSTLSLKGTSVRNHHNTKQNLSSQYCPISNTDQHLKLQQLHTPQQNTSQNNLSLMHQQARYPEASSKFLEHSKPIRRTSLALVNRTHPHILCSNQQTSNQDNHLVQTSTKSGSGQWEQPAALKSSICDHNLNKGSASINYLCGAAECPIAASSTLGKRDAMISGGYSTNSTPTSNISLRIQMNKNGSSNISTSSGKNHNTILPNRSTYGISTCLVDKTKLAWNPKINTIPSLFMIDQSPIATVPSNFQAGPDTAPTIPLQNKYRIIDDNNKGRINKNNILSSEKFRHYLKSHRIHPYLTGTSSQSDSTALALSSKSAMAARKDFQVLPKNSASKSGVAVVSTATSFQQHMQQISCYNV